VGRGIKLLRFENASAGGTIIVCFLWYFSTILIDLCLNLELIIQEFIDGSIDYARIDRQNESML
jgi:hypothetical protein